MTWLLIIVVLAAAFAPVAYMMPSKRDRALADLRMIARREGLEVDVTHLPKLAAEAHERVSASGIAKDARLDCVSYGLRVPKNRAVPTRYRLLRNPGGEFPVQPDSPWELDRTFKPATSPVPEAAYWVVLPTLEPQLPKDVLGLAVTDDFVLCYWHERLPGPEPDAAAVVANIRQVLNILVKHHEDFFTPVLADPEA